MHLISLLQSDIGTPQQWNSLLINYEKPIVKRLWRQEGKYRICLHKIYRDDTSTFFHFHKWPSVMQLLEDSYLMDYGKAKNINDKPPLEKIIHLKVGDSYEMLSELDWHYVQPLKECCYSMMLIGPPFHLDEGKTHANLNAVTEERKIQLLTKFKNILKRD